MNEEDKELLLKDLCTRLPYGVIVKYKSREREGNVELTCDNIGYVTELGNGWWKECKPYLRPISSMTEEEVRELIKVKVLSRYGKEGDYCSLNNIKSIKNIRLLRSNEWFCDVTYNAIDGEYTTCEAITKVTWETTIAEIDWLNEHFFDYRGLIEKGLAIDCTGLHIYD